VQIRSSESAQASNQDFLMAPDIASALADDMNPSLATDLDLALMVDEDGEPEIDVDPSPKPKRNKRKMRQTPPTSDEPEEYSSSDTEPPQHAKRSGMARHEIPMLSSDKLNLLKKQLTCSNLDAELLNMQSIFHPSKGIKDLKPNIVGKILVSLQDQCNQNTSFHLAMQFAPLNKNGSFPWTAPVAASALQQAISAVDALPTLVLSVKAMDMLSTLLRWQSCKALLTIYHWLAFTGPSLLKQLLHLHQVGLETLKTTFPAFAPLVDHAVRHASASKEKSAAKRESKKRRVESSSATFSKDDSSDLTKFPSDLYGLRSTKLSSHITVPLHNARGDIYAVACKLLEDIIWKSIFAPSIKKMDDHFNSSRRTSNDSKSRCLNRGAILNALVLTFQTEGVMATSFAYSLMVTPTSIFSNYHKDDRLASVIMHSPSTAMGEFTQWLKTQLDQKPDLRKCVVSMEKLLLERLQEITSSKIVKSSQKLSSNQLTFLLPSTNITSTLVDHSSSTIQTSNAHVKAVQSLALPSGAVPAIGILGIILREALLMRRGKKYSNIHLFRVMQGMNPISGKQQYNPSHGDPIRKFSGYATLCKEYLDPLELTRPYGISNLLSWMGTGQGEGTKQFLAQLPQKKFIQKTLGESVFIFESGLRRILDWQAKHPEKSTEQGYDSIDDNQIWGQPSAQLSFWSNNGERLNPTKEDLERKLAPYFAEKLQKRWTLHLGSMADTHPKDNEKSKVSWLATCNFIVNLGLAGFGKPGSFTLTGLQMANNLVFLDICAPPSLADMALIISTMGQKAGARAGLTDLGFQTSTPAYLHKAFSTVHKYMAFYLSDEDKETLGFGVIFTEHLLCKVRRWKNRLGSAYNLKDAGESAAEEQNWISAANLNDPYEFPLPLKCSQEDLISVCNISSTLIIPS